jgi:cytochrome c
MTRSISLTAAALLAVCTVAFAQQTTDAQTGELAFNNACRTCHTLKEGDNRLGPSLHAVVGRKAGSLPGYAYSDSMKTSGVVWDEATLDRFIAKPDAVVRGNKMKPFGGVASAEERARIITHLKAGG